MRWRFESKIYYSIFIQQVYLMTTKKLQGWNSFWHRGVIINGFGCLSKFNPTPDDKKRCGRYSNTNRYQSNLLLGTRNSFRIFLGSDNGLGSNRRVRCRRYKWIDLGDHRNLLFPSRQMEKSWNLRYKLHYRIAGLALPTLENNRSTASTRKAKICSTLLFTKTASAILPISP